MVAIDAGEGTVLLLFQKGAASSVVLPGGLIAGARARRRRTFCVRDRRGRRCRPGRRGSVNWGSPIESRVTWERGGTSLYFRDPDHRLVELATPGLWPSY